VEAALLFGKLTEAATTANPLQEMQIGMGQMGTSRGNGSEKRVENNGENFQLPRRPNGTSLLGITARKTTEIGGGMLPAQLNIKCRNLHRKFGFVGIFFLHFYLLVPAVVQICAKDL
jgi:hypothetical protein